MSKNQNTEFDNEVRIQNELNRSIAEKRANREAFTDAEIKHVCPVALKGRMQKTEVAKLGLSKHYSEYTSTRVIDRALLDRFSIFEMTPLNEEDEYTLLRGKFPLINEELLLQLCSVIGDIRRDVASDTARISTMVSTRNTIEIAELLSDDFTLGEAAELLIYPLFPNDGMDSERVFVKQLLQKYVGDKGKNKLFNIDEL